MTESSGGSGGKPNQPSEKLLRLGSKPKRIAINTAIDEPVHRVYVYVTDELGVRKGDLVTAALREYFENNGLSVDDY